MILVDTTPLVALCKPRDPLHARALADLDRVARRGLLVCSPVLTEACFLLRESHERDRLEDALLELDVGAWSPDDLMGFWIEVFAWMRRYQDHAPDWTDAWLCVAAGRQRGCKLWTYDREFTTTWRRPDGSPVPLASR